MIVINNSIKDAVYEELIKHAFNKCNVVMFVSKEIGFNDNDITILRKNMAELENRFKNDFISQAKRPSWVFSKNINDNNTYSNEKFNNLFKVYFYKSSDALKKYLLSNCDLYNWLNPKYPEDIAFFKNGICWLYSVSHEGICDIYLESEEEYNYLKNIGLEFLEENYREIFKEEIYLEELLIDNNEVSE